MEDENDEAERSMSNEEQHSETTTSQIYQNETYDQLALKARVMNKPCSTSADLASKITIIKVELLPNISHGTHLSKSY